MMLDPADLFAIAPRCPHPEAYADILGRAMTDAGISTVTHAAGFLAQLALESDQFRRVREDSDGRYLDGRRDLGNTQAGDGPRYKGRGWPQITGRDRYRLCGEAIGLDLIAHPEQLEDPQVSGPAAAWFWRWAGCAAESDRGFNELVRRWNGGYNDLEIRTRYFTRALEVLGRRATLT